MITRETALRTIRFGAVGGCSTLIYATLAYGFGSAGLAAVAASVAAYGLAAIFSFNAHRRFTFASRGAAKSELPRFLAVNAAGLAIATVAPLVLTEALGLHPLFAIATASVLVPLLSLLAMDRFVFRPAPLEPTAARP